MEKTRTAEPASGHRAWLQGTTAAVLLLGLAGCTEGGSPPLSIEALSVTGFERRTVALEAEVTGAVGGLEYAWQQLSGPALVLDDPQAAAPTILLPEIPAGEVLTAQFEVTAEDGLGRVASTMLTVTGRALDLVILRVGSDQGPGDELLAFDPADGSVQNLTKGASKGQAIEYYTCSPQQSHVAFSVAEAPGTGTGLYLAAVDGSGVYEPFAGQMGVFGVSGIFPAD